MPHGHTPLTFEIHCAVSLSLHAGKGKFCMWLVNEVELHYAKIGFVDSRWSNLNAPWSYTPWSHSLLWSTEGCPFPCMQEKGNAASSLWKSGNLLLGNRFCGLQMVQLECPKVIHPLVSFTFIVNWGVPFSIHAGKGKCCIWILKKGKFTLDK